MIKQVQVSTASWQVGRQVGKSKFWKTCLWIDYVVRYPIASLVAHELMSAWAQSCSRLLAIDLPIRLHTKSDYEFQIFNGFTSKYSPLISVNIYNWIEHRKSQDIDDSTTDRLFFSLQERHITLALSHLPLLLVCLLSPFLLISSYFTVRAICSRRTDDHSNQSSCPPPTLRHPWKNHHVKAARAGIYDHLFLRLLAFVILPFFLYLAILTSSRQDACTLILSRCNASLSAIHIRPSVGGYIKCKWITKYYSQHWPIHSESVLAVWFCAYKMHLHIVRNFLANIAGYYWSREIHVIESLTLMKKPLDISRVFERRRAPLTLDSQVKIRIKNLSSTIRGASSMFTHSTALVDQQSVNPSLKCSSRFFNGSSSQVTRKFEVWVRKLQSRALLVTFSDDVCGLRGQGWRVITIWKFWPWWQRRGPSLPFNFSIHSL